MTTPESHPQRLRVAHLNPHAPTGFLLRPDAETRAAIAGDLGLDGLAKLEFRGELRAEGADGWRLTGRLRARVTQPCVVTLKPVRSSLDDEVRLLFSPHVAAPDGDEVEMPDETVEPLGAFIDLTAIMIEALSLALPEYPRAEDAGLAETGAAADAGDAAEGDMRRPFAGLDKLLGGKAGGGQQG